MISVEEYGRFWKKKKFWAQKKNSQKAQVLKHIDFEMTLESKKNKNNLQLVKTIWKKKKLHETSFLSYYIYI